MLFKKNSVWDYEKENAFAAWKIFVSRWYKCLHDSNNAQTKKLKCTLNQSKTCKSGKQA